METGNKQHADGWDAASKAWERMVLHLPHAEGGVGATFNDITKNATFYTSTSRFVAWLGAFPQDRLVLWLPQDDVQDFFSWSSPPLVLLRDIYSDLLGVSQQQETGPLFLPQVNRLNEAFRVRGGRFQRCCHPHDPSAQAYAPDPEALAAVSSPPADIRGLTPCRAV